MPLNHLDERLADIPRDREVVVHCASGYRSSIAASLLERHGLTQSTALVGGFAAWEASQLATTASA
jgi:rhodanese-related sulfurtransferase